MASEQREAIRPNYNETGERPYLQFQKSLNSSSEIANGRAKAGVGGIAAASRQRDEPRREQAETV